MVREWTLNLLGTREVRRGSCGAWWCRERSLTTQSSTGGVVKDCLTAQEINRWPGKTETSSQSVLLPGELWVESTVGSFGSSSTELPADGTDDRPS